MTPRRFAQGGIVDPRRRYPWELQDDEQGGPPPPMDLQDAEQGPPPPPQYAEAPPPLPSPDMQQQLPEDVGGPPPIRQASPGDRFTPPPPPPMQAQQGPPMPRTEAYQRQAEAFQNRKEPGKGRQILAGVLAATRFRGAAPYVSGEAGRERALENLKVAGSAANEEQQGMQQQIALQNSKRQGEVAQSTIAANNARANRPAPTPPRVPPTMEENTVTRTKLADEQGLSGEDRQRFILTGQMAPPKPAPTPRPTLTQTNTERETEADRLGLKGDSRTTYIANGRIPNPVRPPAPTSPGSAGAQDDAKTIAQGIIEGKQPPTLTGLYRNGAPVRAELQRQGYDLMTAQRDWSAVQRHLSTLNGQQQERLRQAITFTHDSLDNIEQLYQEWKKLGGASGVRILNRGALATSKQIPGRMGEVATNLESQIADLTSELGTVYKGGNASTDESLKLAAQNLQADWNENTFRAAVGQIRKNLTIRRNSIFSSAPMGVSANSPYNPRQPDDSADTVKLQAPDGSVSSVPSDQVDHYLKLGAKRVP